MNSHHWRHWLNACETGFNHVNDVNNPNFTSRRYVVFEKYVVRMSTHEQIDVANMHILHRCYEDFSTQRIFIAVICVLENPYCWIHGNMFRKCNWNSVLTMDDKATLKSPWQFCIQDYKVYPKLNAGYNHFPWRMQLLEANVLLNATADVSACISKL
jgi:hypothetical protein